jgi:hypothetical protein
MYCIYVVPDQIKVNSMSDITNVIAKLSQRIKYT